MTGAAHDLRTRAPGPGGLEVLRVVARFPGAPMAELHRLSERYGDVVRFDAPFLRAVYVRHPDGVQHVLQTHQRNYRRSAFYDEMKPLLGEGLLTSDGEHWLRQRRLAQPAFHKQRIAALGQAMVDEAEAWCARIEALPAPRRVDLLSEMTGLTLSIAARTLFSTDISDFTALVGEELGVAMRVLNDRLSRPVHMPAWMPTRKHRRLALALERLRAVVEGIITERRKLADPEGPGDLLGMLMAAQDEDSGERMSDQQLHDEVMTLILAGHETTANLLTWTLFLLARHPGAEARVQDEADAVFEAGPLRFESIGQLSYTRQVLQESLRLYPPAWILDREVIDDDEIGGYHLAGGTLVTLCPYETHRHPEFWPSPEVFEPDRFSPENSEGRHRYAWCPFGGGPRKCIGADFALVEAQLALAALAARFRVVLAPGYTPALEPLVTLRPKGGMPATLELRR